MMEAVPDVRGDKAGRAFYLSAVSLADHPSDALAALRKSMQRYAKAPVAINTNASTWGDSLSAEEGDGTDQTVTDGLVAAQTLFVNDILSSVVRKGIVAQPKEDESEITVSFPQDLDLEGVESPPGVDSLDALTMRPAPSSIRLWIEAHKLSMLHGHLPPSVVTL